MKVDNPEIWENYIKTGKVQGFSVDAMISLEEVNLKSDINMSEQVKTNSLLEKILLAFTTKPEVKVELGSIKTANGELTIEYDGEALMVGQSAWVTADDGTKVAVPVGEHPLEDGTVLIVTEEGVVAEVKAVVSEEEPMSAEPTVSEGANNDAQIAEEISTAIKSILIKYNEQEQKIVELTAQVEELGKQPVSTGIKQPQVQVDLSKMSKQERILFNLRNN